MLASQRILRLLVPAMAIGLLLAVQSVYFTRGFVPGDAFTYLAAGERLNDGHLLYALSPGDREVDLKPPFWTVPLLSPPPIAVLFRVFAAIPNEIGVYVWWAICIAAIAGTVVAMLRRRPILVGLAVIVLTIPLVYEIGVGNLNALLVAGIVAAWYLLTRGRDVPAGAIIAAMTALKLTPVVLAWWLLTQRRWNGFKGFVLAGLTIAAISVLGAGLSAHIEFLGIIRQTASTGTTVLSLAGLGRFLGVDAGIANALPTLALIAGFAVVWLLRYRPGLAYAAAVVTMLVGSPVINVNWFTILLAALAPLVWPIHAMPKDRTMLAAPQDHPQAF